MRLGIGLGLTHRRRPTPDTDAPVLQSAIISADGLSTALVYDEAVNPASVLAAGGWTLNGTDAAVSSVGASGRTVTLTHDQAVLASDTVTITTSGAPVEDLSGNPAATLSGQAAGTLLSVATAKGASLLLDPYTPASYTLSGSTLTGQLNRITSVAATAIAGTPQYSATGLNGGPAFVFNGTTDYVTGTEAAVLAMLTEDTPFTLIYAAGWDIPDSNGTVFSAGNTAGTSPYKRCGNDTNGTGRHQATRVSAGAAELRNVRNDENGHLASPKIVEWSFDGANIFLWNNRVLMSTTAAGWASAIASALNVWAWGTLIRNSASAYHDGALGALTLCPLLNDPDKEDLYAALKGHHVAMAGLLP